MKLMKIEQVQELRYIVESHFGFFPENIIIESPEIVNEGLQQMSSTNQPDPEHLIDIRMFGVRVAKEITEVVTCSPRNSRS